MISNLIILYFFVLFGIVLVSSGEEKSLEEHPLVECETTKGSIVIEVIPSWAPRGAQRFLELVDDNFYTNIALFRCVRKFLVQFGISDHPSKKHWHRQAILDDPSLNLGIHKNYVSFAGGGPNTRTTQLFIAFEDLDFLGKEPWETPFGRVIKGQETLDNLYKGYGDIPPFGNGPDQSEIFEQGNAYIHRMFPQTDFIHTCSRLIVSVNEEQDQVDADRVKSFQEQEKNLLVAEEAIEKDNSMKSDNDDGNAMKEQQENLLRPEEKGDPDRPPDETFKEEILFENKVPDEPSDPVILEEDGGNDKNYLRRNKETASIVLDHTTSLLFSASNPLLHLQQDMIWKLFYMFVILSAVLIAFLKWGSFKLGYSSNKSQ